MDSAAESIGVGTPSRGRGWPRGSGPKQLAARALLSDTSQPDVPSQSTVRDYGVFVVYLLVLCNFYSVFACFMQ